MQKKSGPTWCFFDITDRRSERQGGRSLPLCNCNWRQIAKPVFQQRLHVKQSFDSTLSPPFSLGPESSCPTKSQTTPCNFFEAAKEKLNQKTTSEAQNCYGILLQNLANFWIMASLKPPGFSSSLPCAKRHCSPLRQRPWHFFLNARCQNCLP